MALTCVWVAPEVGNNRVIWVSKFRVEERPRIVDVSRGSQGWTSNGCGLSDLGSVSRLRLWIETRIIWVKHTGTKRFGWVTFLYRLGKINYRSDSGVQRYLLRPDWIARARVLMKWRARSAAETRVLARIERWENKNRGGSDFTFRHKTHLWNKNKDRLPWFQILKSWAHKIGSTTELSLRN